MGDDLSFRPLGEPAPWNEALPERMSATQITMLARCPEQYRQRYVLGIKAPPGAAMILGIGFGSASEAHLSKYAEDKVGFNENEVAERFVAEYEQAVDEFGGLSEVKWRNDGRISISMARKMSGADKDKGVILTKAYHKEVAPGYQDEVIATEVEVLMEDPTWAVPVIGYLDVETTADIVELKSSGRKSSSPRGDWVVQGRIYQLAVAKPMWWHQAMTTKEPYVIGFDPAMMCPVDEGLRSRTRLLVARSMARLSDYYYRLGPDEPWDDALTHPWACQFCGYRDNCFWWGQ